MLTSETSTHILFKLDSFWDRCSKNPEHLRCSIAPLITHTIQLGQPYYPLPKPSISPICGFKHKYSAYCLCIQKHTIMRGGN